jgi:hypothetical protein
MLNVLTCSSETAKSRSPPRNARRACPRDGATPRRVSESAVKSTSWIPLLYEPHPSPLPSFSQPLYGTTISPWSSRIRNALWIRSWSSATLDQSPPNPTRLIIVGFDISLTSNSDTFSDPSGSALSKPSAITRSPRGSMW